MEGIRVRGHKGTDIYWSTFHGLGLLFGAGMVLD